ncbi:MAG: LPXTG cell wall anchor domain-containing protein [Candidatus Peribacteraceae bacterium]|nr:LPXTG cell wall anchor domain-containing protein [Candidatus Peribacteraceae bacterium]
MSLIHSWKAVLLSAVTLTAFSLVSHASAAGTITIKQESAIGSYGNWELTKPDNSKVNGVQEPLRTLSTDAGTYSFLLSPPADAHVSIKATSGSGTIAETSTNHVSFTLADNQSVLITVTYTYSGMITVDSDPQGVSFELLGYGSQRYVGVTPQIYTNMSPLSYRVTYQRVDGCAVLPQQHRELTPNGSLSFFGKFDCSQSSSSSSSSSIASEDDQFSARVWVSAHQAEVLPGNGLRFTLTVRNTGKRTLQDLVLSAQYDHSKMETTGVLPQGGALTGEVILWNIPQLYAGKYWSVTLPMKIDANAQKGETVTMAARLSGGGLVPDEEHLVATTSVGIVALPQTGIGFDALFLALSGMIALATGLLMKRAQRVAVRA